MDGEPTIPTAHLHPHPPPPRNPTGTRIIPLRASPGLPQSPATHSTQRTYATHRYSSRSRPRAAPLRLSPSLPLDSVARSAGRTIPKTFKHPGWAEQTQPPRLLIQSTSHASTPDAGPLPLSRSGSLREENRRRLRRLPVYLRGFRRTLRAPRRRPAGRGRSARRPRRLPQLQ